jgi:hypothetical protein
MNPDHFQLTLFEFPEDVQEVRSRGEANQPGKTAVCQPQSYGVVVCRDEGLSLREWGNGRLCGNSRTLPA